MKRRLSLFLALLGIVCYASTTFAFDVGTITLSTGSQFQYSSFDFEGTDATQTDIALGVGYFFRDNFEIGLSFSSRTVDNEINGSTSYTTFVPNFTLYFPLADNYLSLELGYESTSGDYEGSALTVGLGYILMITEALSFNASFLFSTGDLDVGSGRVDYDGFVTGTGFSIYFGR